MGEEFSKPLITTIIPTYRRPKLLRRAIRSVLAQTVADFQVCVYDNASGDETAEVVAEFARKDSRVKYHCHAKNIGRHANFTYGMAQVQTPFFSFLSDDDVLLPEFYETTLRGFKEFPKAMFSAGSCINMTDRGEILFVPLSLWQRDGYYTPPDGLFEMMGQKHPTWTAVLFRKEVIDAVGLLDQEAGAASDLDFELRIAARFPFVISKKPCAILVSYPNSATWNGVHSLWAGWPKMIRNLSEDERIPPNVRICAENMLTEMLRVMLLQMGWSSLIRGNFVDGHKAADVLRNYYHLNTTSSVLLGTIKFCEYFPPAHSVLVFLNETRKFLRKYFRRIKTRNLQKQFGVYAEFLKM